MHLSLRTYTHSQGKQDAKRWDLFFNRDKPHLLNPQSPLVGERERARRVSTRRVTSPQTIHPSSTVDRGTRCTAGRSACPSGYTCCRRSRTRPLCAGCPPRSSWCTGRHMKRINVVPSCMQYIVYHGRSAHSHCVGAL